MNNDKLLRALIDALGFDIKEFTHPIELGGDWRIDSTTITPTIEYKLVKRVDKLKAIQDAHQIKLDDIILKGKTDISAAKKAFYAEIPMDNEWEFVTGYADITQAWKSYKRTDYKSFDEWIEYTSSVVQNLRDRGMLPTWHELFESKKDIDDIDWKILGFAGRIEAFECFSKSKYVKAFHSFDDWLEWIRQSKISLSLSR